MVEALKAAGASQRRALQLAGISASTWHYRHRPRPRAATPIPQQQRAYPNRLSPAETQRITDLLAAGFAGGQSVYATWFQALDAGDPVASLSSWYRIAKRYLAAQRPIRRRRRRRATAMPQFEATAANQVWCWDITKLPGRYIGVSYDLYAIIDAFSRYVVGWRIETGERDQLARDLFAATITEQGAVPALVHSDGGAAMTSKTLSAFYQHHGITRSQNRPRVSNDNPFIESWFKTAKYRPDYPKWFADIEHARAWAAAAIDHYNHDHRHSSLAGHTPADVHQGTWPAVHARRQTTLDALAARNPHRWRQRHRLETPYAAVTLNLTNTRQRLQAA